MTSLPRETHDESDRPVSRPGGNRLQDTRLSFFLFLFAYSAAVCAATGVVIYCYKATWASSRPAIVALHELSGDAAALLLIFYLVQHLRRVWGLRRSRFFSWWTGILGNVSWMFAAATGIWGQFRPMPRYETLWWAHSAFSFMAIVIVCVHAAFGFRARAANPEDSNS